jgi:hypothetical protein
MEQLIALAVQFILIPHRDPRIVRKHKASNLFAHLLPSVLTTPGTSTRLLEHATSHRRSIRNHIYGALLAARDIVSHCPKCGERR